MVESRQSGRRLMRSISAADEEEEEEEEGLQSAALLGFLAKAVSSGSIGPAGNGGRCAIFPAKNSSSEFAVGPF